MTTTPLSAEHKAKLIGSGVCRGTDLKDVSAEPLAAELSVDVDDARAILDALSVRPLACVSACAAYDAPRPAIVSFCQALDGALGGGARVGEVLEICGEPGTGKTQMALQLALDARIPASFGGVDGRALYLDCEGGFSATRARELAHGLAEHLAWIARRDAAAEEQGGVCGVVWRWGGRETSPGRRALVCPLRR